MKFQVSVLSDKGVKKVIATVDADYFTEEVGEPGKRSFILSNYTRVRFYTDDGGWFSGRTLVSSLLLSTSYVIEQVSL